MPDVDAAESHRVRMVLRILRRKPVSILDVGCGDGYLCSVYKSHFGIANVVGADLAGARVARARATFPDIKFTRADIYNLPFEDGGFEVVSAVEVLEHLEDPARAFGELVRVAAREVIVTVPNNEELTRHVCPHCFKTFYLDGHIQRFERRRLMALAEEAGWKVRRMINYRPWEETHLIKKIYSPLKKVLFRKDFESGGWLAMAAVKPL